MVQNSPKKRKQNSIWIAAIVLASILLVILLASFLPKIFISIFEEGGEFFDKGWEGNVMIAMFILYLLGYLVVWFKTLIGGIIILLSAIVEMGPFLIIDQNMGSLIFGVPIAVAGILFIVSYYQQPITNNLITPSEAEGKQPTTNNQSH